MILPTQKFNVFDNATINRCIENYKSFESYETSTMNKADPLFALDLLKPVLEDVLEKNLIYSSGNYYKHTIPYLPHSDYKKYENNILNVVIPLLTTNENNSLIIFDQTWNLDSVTWCMHYPVQYFESNIGVKGCPYEYPIKGCTNQDIDDNFYLKYLKHYKKEDLFSLSGKAYPYQPGSIIIFDSRNIHCTSYMTGKKLGITLRFKI